MPNHGCSICDRLEAILWSRPWSHGHGQSPPWFPHEAPLAPLAQYWSMWVGASDPDRSIGYENPQDSGSDNSHIII